MVSYERWGMFYLRLYRRLRPTPLLVVLFGAALVVLFWSPAAGAVMLVALVLFEGWLFERRVCRALVGKGSGSLRYLRGERPQERSEELRA